MNIHGKYENGTSKRNGLFFSVNDLSHCRSCGTKRYNWDKEYREQNIDFVLYSEKDQNVKLLMKLDQINIVQMKIQLKKGFQHIKLPMYYEESVIKDLNKSKEKYDLKKSDNGKTYFIKGSYSLSIGDYSESFQIK